MPIIATSKSDAPREMPEADLHNALCVFVEDVGWQKNHFDPEKPAQHKVLVFWELQAKMTDGKPFMLSKRYTLSLHEKATLRHDLEAWRGKPFTEEEMDGFDIEKLIGVQCRLVVVHKATKQGGTRAEVSTIMKADPNAKMQRVNTTPPKWIEDERSRALK